MVEITYSQYELETFLLILVRMTSFMYQSSFFSQGNTPQRAKLGLAIFVSFLVYQLLPPQETPYGSVLDYAVLVIREGITGMLLAFVTYICSSIVLFAGSFIDMEIGLSMATLFDPQSGMQVTISGKMYQTIFFLISIVSGTYYYLLSALVDSFKVVPLGEAQFGTEIISVLVGYLANYFILGFRIALPIFASSLIVNIILGIMTKVAPQIHMFSIGMQLKVLSGLIVMFATLIALPNITAYISDEMKQMLAQMVGLLAP